MEETGGPSAGSNSNNRSAHTTSAAVTVDEALDILSLPPNPDKQAVIDAHRTLIRQMHPDRGRSHYLATKINLAKLKYCSILLTRCGCPRYAHNILEFTGSLLVAMYS